jgi:RNA polymerase sigma-70 factor (ECF subfamily)
MRLSLELLIDRYQKNLFAAALNVCANAQDAEDVVQDTFLQYYSANKQFNDEEHIKAWLLRVAINKAKDVTRRSRRKNTVSLEDLNEDIPFEDPEVETFFDEVMSLPEKYRVAIHLFYYEDMAVKDIANCLQISEGNVKMRLSRGRDLLKERLTEDDDNDRSGKIQKCG